MPTSRTKRLLFSGAAALGVAAGAAGIAGAATGGTTQNPASPAQAETDEAPDSNFTSSVTVADDTEMSETDEAATLEGLATVTSDEARTAALAAVPGTAADPELDNEDGNVVWSVEITAADGTLHEVVIDAGNANVLAQDIEEADDENEADEANEGPEANESEADEANEGPETNEANEAPNG